MFILTSDSRKYSWYIEFTQFKQGSIRHFLRLYRYLQIFCLLQLTIPSVIHTATRIKILILLSNSIQFIFGMITSSPQPPSKKKRSHWNNILGYLKESRFSVLFYSIPTNRFLTADTYLNIANHSIDYCLVFLPYVTTCMSYMIKIMYHWFFYKWTLFS